MSEYRLRPATNQDVEKVKKLVFSVLGEYGLRPDPEGTDADLADIEASYIKPGGIFDLMEDDAGDVVGTVGLFQKGNSVCELRKMYLVGNVRGKGLGKKMLNHAITRARELGFEKIELETASVLKEAISLYTSYGFKKIERHLVDRCDQAYALDILEATNDI
ncbi:MAG: GNAT family N-acetyltransferase [Blastocatellia bacterium]|nr:GNAT family N-acetyltransferase [Blastocatellia bacterium]